jgi:hypothetical protein
VSEPLTSWRLARFRSPRCGARCKSTGLPCTQAGIRKPDGSYSRCRLHGGLSTGARTAEGIERIRKARTKHGYYTPAKAAARKQRRTELTQIEEQVRSMETPCQS